VIFVGEVGLAGNLPETGIRGTILLLTVSCSILGGSVGDEGGIF